MNNEFLEKVEEAKKKNLKEMKDILHIYRNDVVEQGIAKIISDDLENNISSICDIDYYFENLLNTFKEIAKKFNKVANEFNEEIDKLESEY